MPPSKIAVVGAGPVGLATADQLSLSGREVVLVCQDGSAANAAGTTQIPATFPAAAAFWTPFSSGTSAADEARRSRRTFDFYKQLQDGAADPGVVWRTVEQHWLQGTAPAAPPPWAVHEGLNFSVRPRGNDYVASADDRTRFRCEFSYAAPVVQVAVFRQWYLRKLQQQGVVLCQGSHPLAGADAGDGAQGSAEAEWRELLESHDVATVVACTGVGTVYYKLLEPKRLPPGAVAFKKGVVAHVRVPSERGDPVLMYEGGAFDVDKLYLVPQGDFYVLGGTAHLTGVAYDQRDWLATPAERAGILERAQACLPDWARTKLAAAALWDAAPSHQVEWRTGVRPVLAGHGPYVGESPELATQLTGLLGRPVAAYAHFGHGGSGFTLCQDTAHELAQMLS